MSLIIPKKEEESNFLDYKSVGYISVVYEMALSQDINYVMKKTGVSLTDLNKLKEDDNFKRDLDNAKKEISSKGVSSIKIKAEAFAHEALDELRNMISRATTGDMAKIAAIKQMLEVSGNIKNNDDEVKTQPLIVNFTKKEPMKIVSKDNVIDVEYKDN